MQMFFTIRIYPNKLRTDQNVTEMHAKCNPAYPEYIFFENIDCDLLTIILPLGQRTEAKYIKLCRCYTLFSSFPSSHSGTVRSLCRTKLMIKQ